MAEGERSAKELAAEVELPIRNVAYHIGILREADLIEATRHVLRRGTARETYYRRTKRDAAAIDAVLAVARKLR